MAIWPLPKITFRELSAVQETRRVALLTSEETWAALSASLSLPLVIQAEPSRYDRDLFEYLAQHLPSTVEVIYAVGSGAPVEAAKVVAGHNHLPLVIIPPALDSVAMLTPYAVADEPVGERKRRTRLETGPAAEVILDWDVIADALPAQRGAGIADMLAIVTGLLDWRYAAQRGKNPRAERFQPWAAGVTTDLAKQAIKSAPAIGQGDREALQTLLSLMMVAVQLNNLLGHGRAQQGSEHHLADLLAVTSNGSTPSAERLGPCILFCAALHGQDPAPLREALSAANIPLDRIRATDFRLLLDHLAEHLADHRFPYSILNDLDPTSEQVSRALEQAGLALRGDAWTTPAAAQPAASAAQPPAREEAEVAAAEALAEDETPVEQPTAPAPPPDAEPHDTAME